MAEKIDQGFEIMYWNGDDGRSIDPSDSATIISNRVLTEDKKS